MKRVYFILAALIVGFAMRAQATPAEKQDLRNDMAKERVKRHEVAKDILTHQPEKARADNRAAIADHKEVHRDIRNIHENNRRRRYHPHHRVYHHRVYHHRVYHHRHYRHNRTTVVVVQH